MGLELNNIVVAASRKRVDADVVYDSWWRPDYTAKFRIVSREEIPEENVKDLLNQIHDRKKDWKQGKKNQVLSLTGLNATAYILDYKETEVEPKDEAI